MAVDTHLFHNRRPRVRVYTLTDPTHNPPNKFNYCDHIFATEGLLAKFAKIKTAQKFVVIRYIGHEKVMEITTMWGSLRLAPNNRASVNEPHTQGRSQYDATLTQRDAGRGVNYAGIGSISNPASRCVALR